MTTRPARAADPPRMLKVITYNVQFLPGLARMANKRKDPDYRARTIGRAMAAYDIVGLNETFDDPPRKLLLEELQKAWPGGFHAVSSPKPADNRINGGLVIASRFPLVETNSTIYTQCSLPKDYGIMADGFAAKGVLHARIRVAEHAADSECVDVFVTHMEARDDAIRETQYPELAEFVRQHSDPARPVLIMGDLNTRGDARYREQSDSQYRRLMAALMGSSRTTLTDLWPRLYPDQLGGTTEQESSDKGHRIDYIMVSNPTKGDCSLVPVAIRVNGFLDQRVVALSDHSAVEAEFSVVSEN